MSFLIDDADGYAAAEEILEYFDHYRIGTLAPIASIIRREREKAAAIERRAAIECDIDIEYAVDCLDRFLTCDPVAYGWWRTVRAAVLAPTPVFTLSADADDKLASR